MASTEASKLTTRLLLSFLFIALTIYLSYVVERSNFTAFISAYGLFFAGYVWLITRLDWTQNDRRWWIGLGIALRLILLFSLPNLSDDFYRFLWDGRLAAQGIHPFAHPPVYFIENQIELAGITPDLFSLLNSPEYYTVYPPVCQAVFWLAAKLFPESLAGGVLVLKFFLLVFELGVIWVLGLVSPPPRLIPSPIAISTSQLEGKTLFQFQISNFKFQIRRNSQHREHPFYWKFEIGNLKLEKCFALKLLELRAMVPGAAVIYALNPLILLEITGNAHFEGAMLFFLLAGLLALQRNRLIPAAAFLALATASKLVPLLFLPILWVQLGWRLGLRFLLWFAGFTAVLFAPLLNLEIIENIAGSLNLYFRQFAFNASFYYVLKMIGKAWVEDQAVDVGRTLGPILGLVVFLGVWAIAVFSPRRHGDTKIQPPGKLFSVSPCLRGEKLTPFLLAATLYLVLATTVHPWYIALPFGLGLLTRWRFPIVWTGVAALSYSHYDGGGFKENYWWIALEYLLLFGFLLWEIYANRGLKERSGDTDKAFFRQDVQD